jgi:hypothetical protein
MRLTERLDEMRGDVRLAVRQLIAAPVFTVVAALTLALGVGVNSAIFAGRCRADVRCTWPAERLAMLWERTPSSPKTGVSPLNMRDWSLQSRSFQGIAYVQRGMGGGPLLTAPDGSIETAERQSISANFFDVLGHADRRPHVRGPDGATPRVVLLGEACGAAGSASGRCRKQRAVERTALQSSVSSPALTSSRVSRNLTLTPQFLTSPVTRHGHSGGRAPEAGRDDGSRASGRGTPTGWRDARTRTRGRVVEPIRGESSAGNQTTSAFLGIVILCALCCANVANLLLARHARAREIAVQLCQRRARTHHQAGSRRAWCWRPLAGRSASGSAPGSSGPRPR